MESETHSTETKRTEGEHSEKAVPVETTAQMTMEKLIARLTALVETMERAVKRPEMAASEAVGPIVAMVEGSNRESELTQKLADAEKTIAELRASSSSREGRRTLPVSLLAKQDGAAPEPGAIDAALLSLSLEQRIAVKAQLLRSGLV